MYIPPYQADIIRLYDAYNTPKIFHPNPIKGNVESMYVSSFLGSTTSLDVKATKCIKVGADGCIAAPRINLYARANIFWSVNPLDPSPAVRLYAPEGLSITSNVICLGNFTILYEPENASILCNRLTLIQPVREEPEVFEIVKSWVEDDNTEVEKIKVEDPTYQWDMVE